MAYAFDRADRTIEEAVRRIAGEQIGAAIEAVDRCEPGDATIHKIRKGCKKLRALIGLVRPFFDGFRVENSTIRDAARSLSAARDAEVAVQTFDGLFANAGDAEAFAPVRARLAERLERISDTQDLAALLASFRVSMLALQERAGDWPVERDGFDALERGLEKAFASARKSMARAKQKADAATVHEWRKSVKNHWYHARLLSPAWPGPLEAHAKAAEALGDRLGLHHDLSLFQAIEPKLFGDKAARLALLALARQRQGEIENECFELGTRLLAEPANRLARRWRTYWDVWRGDDEGSLVA